MKPLRSETAAQAAPEAAHGDARADRDGEVALSQTGAIDPDGASGSLQEPFGIAAGHHTSDSAPLQKILQGETPDHVDFASTVPNKKSDEYRIWYGIKRRCTAPSCVNYPHYGAVGIQVCQSWIDSFAAFFAEVGPRPGKGYSIDRIDNSRGYEPGNVRWATWSQQHSNRNDNHILEAFGRRKNITEWGREFNIAPDRIRRRIVELGWTAEKAIAEPAHAVDKRDHQAAYRSFRKTLRTGNFRGSQPRSKAR